MKNRLMQMPLLRSISQSFSRKIIAVTISGLILGFLISIMTSNSGLTHLKNQSIEEVRQQLLSTSRALYIGRLNTISDNLYSQFETANAEGKVFSAVNQSQTPLALTKSEAEKETFNWVKPQTDDKLLTEAFWSDWQRYLRGQKSEELALPIFMHKAAEKDMPPQLLMLLPTYDKNKKVLSGAFSHNIKLKSFSTLTTLVDNPKIVSMTGFSDGLFYGLNDEAAHSLGLKPNNEVGQLKAYRLSESSFPAVKGLALPSGTGIANQSITLNGISYWAISKRTPSFLSWNPIAGIYPDYVITLLLIPESSLLPVMTPIEEGIEKSAQQIILKQSGILLLLFAFIATIIFLIYEQLAHGLNRLMKATEQIKKRNFNIEIELEANDEFNALAQSFNSMTSEIKAVVQQLTAQNELLKEEMDLKTRMDEQIAYMKQYDNLTGLPNKQSLYRRLDELIVKSHQESKLGAVVVLGIDQFKKINEAYGIEIGDELLKIFAKRLRTGLGADLVSRITGDEFCIVFYGLTALDDVLVRLERLQSIISSTYTISDHDLYLSASIGISSFPSDTQHSKDLVKYATSAMMSAKESQQSDQFRFYDVNIEKNLRSKVDLMNSLRQAIDKDELQLNYQPITDGSSGKILGLEALLRWHSDAFGYIPPNIFIPLAEEMRYIAELEKWVIQRVIRDLDIIDASALKDAYVSINISAIDLDSHVFMDYLIQTMSDLGSRASKILLEITEGVLIHHYDSVVPKLRQLADLGVKIALDDFGTGYSSMKYIKHLPIHCLKIDRSFVKDYPSLDDGSIAGIIINLAKAFKLKVIAEGVETEGQASFLLSLGCDAHQGFYYSRPLTLGGLIHQLEP